MSHASMRNIFLDKAKWTKTRLLEEASPGHSKYVNVTDGVGIEESLPLRDTKLKVLCRVE